MRPSRKARSRSAACSAVIVTGVGAGGPELRYSAKASRKPSVALRSRLSGKQSPVATSRTDVDPSLSSITRNSPPWMLPISRAPEAAPTCAVSGYRCIPNRCSSRTLEWYQDGVNEVGCGNLGKCLVVRVMKVGDGFECLRVSIAEGTVAARCPGC